MSEPLRGLCTLLIVSGHYLIDSDLLNISVCGKQIERDSQGREIYIQKKEKDSEREIR